MSNEVAVRQESVVAAPESLLSVIARVSNDPRGVNVDVMERLLAMQERIAAEDKRTAYQEALTRLQERVPHIDKKGLIKDNSGNVRNRFAKLEDVDRAVRPLMAEEGFAISFNTEDSPKGITVIGKMMHRAGYSEEKRITLEVDKSGSKNGTQSVGSTVSYGRRYLMKMFLNIIEEEEDTDGNDLRTISQEQADKLRDWSDSLGNSEGFKKFMGVSKVEDILLRDHAKAVNALKSKERKNAGA